MKQLPSELRKQPARFIKDLNDGERAWAFTHAIEVDPDGNCWLNPCSTLQPRRWLFDMAEIFRTGGEFHITIPKKPYPTSKHALNDTFWLPVASVRFRRRSWLHVLLGDL